VPEQKTLSIQREPVSGACPECGAEELCRHPVLSEGGWWNAVKCQACLASMERERGGLFGSLVTLSAGM